MLGAPSLSMFKTDIIAKTKLLKNIGINMDQSKQKRTYLLFVIVIALFAFGFITRTLISQSNEPTAESSIETSFPSVTSRPQVSTASKTPEPTKPLEQTPTVIGAIDQMPTSGAMMVLSQKVNGIEITAHNIRRGDNQLKADICIPIVDSDDWMLNQISLQYNGKEIKDWGGSLIDPYIPASDGQPGRRCDMVYFAVSDQEEITEFTISVISISAPPREGGMCERIDTIQKQLDAQNSGIKLACQEGNGMAGYHFLTKPDAMSENEARIVVMNVMNRVTQGPWNFLVRLR